MPTHLRLIGSVILPQLGWIEDILAILHEKGIRRADGYGLTAHGDVTQRDLPSFGGLATARNASHQHQSLHDLVYPVCYGWESFSSVFSSSSSGSASAS